MNTIFKKFIDRFRKKKPEDEEIKEETSTIGSGSQISSKIRSYLEKELLTVRFLDWISEESFDFIYQQKIYDNYIGTHTEQFLNLEKVHPTEKERVSKLKAEFERLKVKEAAYAVKEHSEEVAKRNNIKAPYLKRFNRINIIIMAALIGAIFVFQIPALRAYSMWSFLLILPVCFLPNYIKKQMKKKWNEFKYLHREELQEEIFEEIHSIKTFIQILMDDARDYMLQEHFPLQVLEFPLMSSDYRNVELVKENIQEEQIQYVCRFEYPEGMEPFETPTTMKAGGVGVSTAVSNMELADDNANDLFLIVKNPQYKKDGTLNTKKLELVELIYKPIVETLLENSDFDRIEDIESIITDIEEVKEFQCSCGEPTVIGEIQKVTPRSYKEFSFYLMIGEKCEKCGSNPFILAPLPDMTVPEELIDIFIDPIPREADSSNEETDLFSVIKNVNYSEEKTLQLKDYKPVVLENVVDIQELLGNSSFKKLKEPIKRFPDFEDAVIPCGCDDTTKLVNVQLVTVKDLNFKFYLLMGKKCTECNVEPFLLIPAPDEEIPEELNKIF